MRNTSILESCVKSHFCLSQLLHRNTELISKCDRTSESHSLYLASVSMLRSVPAARCFLKVQLRSVLAFLYKVRALVDRPICDSSSEKVLSGRCCCISDGTSCSRSRVAFVLLDFAGWFANFDRGMALRCALELRRLDSLLSNLFLFVTLRDSLLCFFTARACVSVTAVFCARLRANRLLQATLTADLRTVLLCFASVTLASFAYEACMP